ncbi:MAG: MarR family transcriptional regulator [Roseibium sp.]
MDQLEIAKQDSGTAFELEQFFRYQIRVFYRDVTQALSAVYQRDYDLSPAEWRTMAILAAAPIGLQAGEIVARSSMDKVVVSRAVKRMKERGLLEREANAVDGRSYLVKLSEKGLAAHDDLVPKLLEVEQKMLAGLDGDKIKSALSVMQKIRRNLEELADKDI